MELSDEGKAYLADSYSASYHTNIDDLVEQAAQALPSDTIHTLNMIGEAYVYASDAAVAQGAYALDTSSISALEETMHRRMDVMTNAALEFVGSQDYGDQAASVGYVIGTSISQLLWAEYRNLYMEIVSEQNQMEL